MSGNIMSGTLPILRYVPDIGNLRCLNQTDTMKYFHCFSFCSENVLPKNSLLSENFTSEHLVPKNLIPARHVRNALLLVT